MDQESAINVYTILRNYLKRCARRIHAGRQLIMCSTLYVCALQNLFRGQNMTKMVAQLTYPEMQYMGTVFKYYVCITSMFKQIDGGAAL